jgi:hypothetical protein
MLTISFSMSVLLAVRANDEPNNHDETEHAIKSRVYCAHLRPLAAMTADVITMAHPAAAAAKMNPIVTCSMLTTQ